jgi:hypothetical protein
MSFNKRFFNFDGLVQSASKDSFEVFDRAIMKTDAFITDPDLTSDFLNLYVISKKESRELLKDLLIEREVFVRDFIRCYTVKEDERNEEKHENGVGNYTSLFFSKWGDLAEKYKNILEL